MGAAEFHYIALAGHTKRRGKDWHPAGDDKVTPAFPKICIMRVLMHQCAADRPQVFRPLTFDVDQRPLPAAELEMLDAGKLKVILLLITHANLSQVTPAGSRASSTVTA